MFPEEIKSTSWDEGVSLSFLGGFRRSSKYIRYEAIRVDGQVRKKEERGKCPAPQYLTPKFTLKDKTWSKCTNLVVKGGQNTERPLNMTSQQLLKLTASSPVQDSVSRKAALEQLDWRRVILKYLPTRPEGISVCFYELSPKNTQKEQSPPPKYEYKVIARPTAFPPSNTVNVFIVPWFTCLKDVALFSSKANGEPIEFVHVQCNPLVYSRFVNWGLRVPRCFSAHRGCKELL